MRPFKKNLVINSWAVLLGTSLLWWSFDAAAQASDESSVDADTNVGVLIVHIEEGKVIIRL